MPEYAKFQLWLVRLVYTLLCPCNLKVNSLKMQIQHMKKNNFLHKTINEKEKQPSAIRLLLRPQYKDYVLFLKLNCHGKI